MDKSLKIKAAFIVAVILICIYGIIGLPKSKEELVSNWNNNIKLGLDLRGGSHLVLQVQVQDAFIAEAQEIVERLKEELAKASVTYTAIESLSLRRSRTPKRPSSISVGCRPRSAGALRTAVTERAPGWTMSSAGSDYVLKITQTDCPRSAAQYRSTNDQHDRNACQQPWT